MKKGDRVMIVANHAIRENKCGHGTLEKYIGTDHAKYGGYAVETWEVWFDEAPAHEGTYKCRMLVADEPLWEPDCEQ